MPVLDLNNANEVKKYNDFLLSHKGTSIMQTLEWGKVKKGWSLEAVYLEEEGKIVAAMTVLLKKLPVLNSHLMYAAKGPVVDFYDIDKVNKLIKEAKPLIKKYNVFALRMDPELKREEKLEKLYSENGFKVRNEGKDKVSLIQPRYNMILDLENDTEESLMKRFSEKTRYNIRLSGRKGVTVRYSHDIEDLKKFYELYEITGKRDNFLYRGYPYFEHMLKTLNKENIRIYIAEHEGEALSGAICVNYGGKVWYMYGASSNVKRNKMPNYAMQFEMIKWALETKAKYYDFGGVFVLNKEDGLYKFKEGFCRQEGVTEFVGEFDKVFNKFVYFLFEEIVPFIQNMKRKLNSNKNK